MHILVFYNDYLTAALTLFQIIALEKFFQCDLKHRTQFWHIGNIEHTMC